MTEHVRWLTYDEVAREMGIARESARQLAIRKRWARRKGNDSKARVGVPEEEFQARVTGEDTPHRPSDATSDDTGHDPSVVQVLTRHISRLESAIEVMKQEQEAERSRVQGEMDVLRQERDVERGRATLLQTEAAAAPALRQTVEALKGALDGERDRARDLRAERDRFLRDLEQQMTRRSWWPFRRAG